MMRFNKLAIIVAALGAFAITQVSAEESVAPVKPAHKLRADSNQDGKVSQEEFRVASEKRSERMFKRMDTNNDGFIDEAERRAAYEKMREHRRSHETAPVSDSKTPS